MLTALDTLADRVRGLDLGADDYLAKPFDLPELEARVRALLRRGTNATTPFLQHGRLRLDTVGRRVFHDDQPVELSARELAVLELLLMREGRVVSKEHMVNHLYGWDDEVGANAIEVYVYRIRRKLEPLGCEIRTVRGMGYLMERIDESALSRGCRASCCAGCSGRCWCCWCSIPRSTYWTSLNFSNRAHDRSLLEIAREVALHVKADRSGPAAGAVAGGRTDPAGRRGRPARLPGGHRSRAR